MSKIFDFDQTSIPTQYSISLKNNHGYVYVDSRTGQFCRVLFSSIANMLKFKQSKNLSRIGMRIKDDKGNFKFGAILNYRKPEEGAEEDTGNWYLEFTFNESDMTDLDEEIDNHSDVFVSCMKDNAEKLSNGYFRSSEDMYNMVNTLIDTLVNFLDVNASETEEVTVQLPSVFTMSVVIEGGEKIFSIVPGEVIKQLIKNDAA